LQSSYKKIILSSGKMAMKETAMSLYKRIKQFIEESRRPSFRSEPPQSSDELKSPYWKNRRELVYVCSSCETAYELRERTCVFCGSKSFKKRIWLRRRVLWLS